MILQFSLEDEIPFEAIKQIGERVLEYAQQSVPIKTGKLFSSLKVEIDEALQSVTIGSDLDYSVYVELGTSKMAAHPYLVPALFQALSEYDSEIPALVEDMTS
jgi:hypothetical protein